MSGKRVTSADVTKWLLEETPEHMALMSRLRQRLSDTMMSDVNEHGTPTRDWARILGRYQLTYKTLLDEDRERMKMRLLMAKEGQDLLSDDEYEKELATLAVESLGTLPADALQRELERRGAMALREDPRAMDDEKDDADD